MSSALTISSSGNRILFKLESSILRLPTWAIWDVREGITSYGSRQIHSLPKSGRRRKLPSPAGIYEPLRWHQRLFVQGMEGTLLSRGSTGQTDAALLRRTLSVG